jgi:hypothetical protein
MSSSQSPSQSSSSFMVPSELPSNNKFILGVCELYHPQLHGNINADQVSSHFLTLCRLNTMDVPASFVQVLNSRNTIETKHPIIRNYNSICKHRKHKNHKNNQWIDTIDICECHYLPTHECIAIIKTHWLRLVQKTWKRCHKNGQPLRGMLTSLSNK